MKTTFGQLKIWDKFHRVGYPYPGRIDETTVWQKVEPSKDKYGTYNAINLSDPTMTLNASFLDNSEVKKLPKDYKP